MKSWSWSLGVGIRLTQSYSNWRYIGRHYYRPATQSLYDNQHSYWPVSTIFARAFFSKVDSVEGEVVCPLSMNPLLKQTRPACFKPPACSCSGSFNRILVGIYENKLCTIEKSTTLYCNGVQLEHKGALVFEKILSMN